MKNNNKPNYVMLRLMNLEKNIVKKNYPEAEQMVSPHICPGFDIDIMEPLSVLRYIYRLETQWSCQGNHKDYLSHGYILLAPDNRFPSDLISILNDKGILLTYADDFKLDEYGEMVKTDKFRARIGVSKGLSDQELFLMNQVFVKTLNDWSTEEIKNHIPFMMKDKYFDSFIKLYI